MIADRPGRGHLLLRPVWIREAALSGNLCPLRRSQHIVQAVEWRRDESRGDANENARALGWPSQDEKARLLSRGGPRRDD